MEKKDESKSGKGNKKKYLYIETHIMQGEKLKTD